jgi:hypothetical protein
MKQNEDDKSLDTVPVSRGCREYHKSLAVPYPARGKIISAIAHICMCLGLLAFQLVLISWSEVSPGTSLADPGP